MSVCRGGVDITRVRLYRTALLFRGSGDFRETSRMLDELSTSLNDLSLVENIRDIAIIPDGSDPPALELEENGIAP